MTVHRLRAAALASLALALGAGVARGVRADDPPGAPAQGGPTDDERVEGLKRARALDTKAGPLLRKGQHAEATPLAREALEIREKLLGPEHLDVAASLSNLGEVLSAQGAYAEARTLFERALAIREKALGKENLDVATSLNSLGMTLQRQGAYGEARARYEQALEIREKVRGKDHPDVAQSLNNLAVSLAEQGLHREAQPHLERALAICERALGREHLHVAVVLDVLAAVLRAQGAYVQAREASERALAIADATLGARHPFVATSLDTLARTLEAEGAYARARTTYERALAVREGALGTNHPEVAASLNNLGMLLQLQGAYAEARTVHERAQALLEAALGKDHPNVATSLNNLATLLRAQGAHAEARPLLERAVVILEKALGPDHPYVASAVSNLALLLQDQGDHEAAGRLHERALAIREKAPGMERRHVAASLNSLAGVRRAQGAHAEARALCERARELLEQAFGSEHPEVGMHLSALAGLRALQGDRAGARPLHERAIAILEKTLGPDHPHVASSLCDFAVLLGAGGAHTEAVPLLERALSITESRAREGMASLSPAQRIALVRSIRYRLDHWIRFAPHVGRSGYAEVLRFRGLVARAESAERALARRATGEERSLQESLAAAQRLVARLANEVPPTKSAEALAIWQKRYAGTAAERERLTLELSRRSAPLRGALERLELGLPAVQAQIAADAALVDYLRVGDGYLAFVVRRAGEPARVPLGDAGPIEEASTEFLKAVRTDETDAAGAVLRRLVWAPIEKALGAGVARVVICPDMALAAVPFGALPGKATGRTLQSEYAISYVGQAQDLVPWKDAPPPGVGALLVGGVDYGRAEAGATPASGPGEPRTIAMRDRAPAGTRFEPLLETGAEAEGLRARFGADATTLLLGTEASEARLRHAVVGKRVLHVATHGFAREDLLKGLYSRKIEEAFLSADAERQLAAGHDPMLLSGLALAGANPREGGGGDDGILTALEASYLDLDGVELVTLSACETARGTPESGEGVQGLVRAFQMAGARTVIASLWKVDDEATRLLMEGVYERMLREENPLSPAHALREASLALRELEDAAGKPRFASPRYWAAFVAYSR
jgi:CHAT domain-containing protein/Tfp pilus assembly protein PilF